MHEAHHAAPSSPSPIFITSISWEHGRHTSTGTRTLTSATQVTPPATSAIPTQSHSLCTGCKRFMRWTVNWKDQEHTRCLSVVHLPRTRRRHVSHHMHGQPLCEDAQNDLNGHTRRPSPQGAFQTSSLFGVLWCHSCSTSRANRPLREEAARMVSRSQTRACMGSC
ncbi:hypothetical protein BDW22DRAFT_66511 [Trametopsis cervina]|nr:hypothetical protein BDW22DRAFT_66511 [Trametopsis cervina]